MMNIDVLEEQWLNYCKLSSSMLLVDIIRVFGFLFKYNLLGIEGISDSKFWGKDPWMFRKFRDENWRGKVEL